MSDTPVQDRRFGDSRAQARSGPSPPGQNIERALRESEERYRLLLETLPQLVWTGGPDGDCDYLSRQWLEYTGIPESEQLGSGWLLALHPEDRKRAQEAWRAAVEDRGVYDLEYRIRRADGVYRWFKTRGVPLRDGGGSILKWFGTSTDIEDQRRAVDEVRRSEQHLRKVLDSLSAFVGVLTPAGILIQANRAPLEAAGLRPEDVLGKPFWDAYWWSWSPEVQNQLREACNRALRGESSRYDVQVRMRGGRLMTIDFALVPMFDPGGAVTHLIPSGIDITDRKNAEQALRESEQRFRQLADAIPHLVWTTDSQGAHEYFNQRWHEYTGLSFEQSRGWGWRAALHPDDVARTDQRWGKSVQSGEVYEIDYRLRSASGEYRWFLGRAEPIRDSAGRITRWFGTCTDIDRQRRAEQALELSRERFDLVIRSVDLGLWYCDLPAPELAMVWNETARRQFGLPEKLEITAEVFYQRLHEDDRERVRHAVERAINDGEPYDVQYRVVTEAGAVRWIRSIGRTFRDSEARPARFDGVMIDITNQKRTEEIIRESQERLTAALNASDTGTFRWNIRTGELEWDSRLCRMFGLGPDEHVRRLEDFIERVHPDDRAPVTDAARRCIELGEDFDYEFRILWPDGSVHWIADKGRTVRGAGGAPEYVTGACVDLTERRRSEEAVRQAQKLESLGVLAGGIAHDFNNLLVGIMGNAGMVQESLPESHPDWQRLQGIVRASERAADLTRQLLAYAGKGQFLLESVDLSDLVREINALIETSIPKRVRLSIDLARGLPLIEADRGQVQQVVMNLLINAAEAIPEASHGMVRAATFARVYDAGALAGFHGPAAQAPGLYVGIEVQDNGAGMDPATLTRIFDPFYTTKFTGRGLGLSAVQGIVRASRGALQVVSTPGLGTRFTVLFPAAGPAAGTLEQEAVRVEHGGGRMVLIVDDEDLVRDTVSNALERYGYRVMTAADGQAAAELFAAHAGEIAAVLLDLTMPLMSGEETLAAIRRIRPGVPVLLSSGYSESDAVLRFQGQNLAGFIQKPYTAARAAQKIAAALAQPDRNAC